MHPSDCYRILMIPRDASIEDIKLAYRRLARKYHPDVNPDDPSAAEKFRLVQEAYQILKDIESGVLPRSAVQAPPNKTTKPTTPPTTPKNPPKPPKPPGKVKVEVREVRQQVDPINSDPELKLKLDMLRRLQDLLKQKKYVVAIAVAEGMAQRFPKSPEITHWQAVTYHRWATELILTNKLREAESYLNKALTTDPSNRELCFEVRRDLERVKHLVSSK